MDAYFSADVETDGPIPGPYSMLSFALVYAGSFDGRKFSRPANFERRIYKELKPISDQFQEEALRVNGLDRNRLRVEGETPESAMTETCRWVKETAGNGSPVLVAYPLSFDWAWLYWYFIRFSASGSPFGYSRCFDLKTAHAVIPEEKKAKGKVKNYKLKHSRLLTCYSALLYLLAVYSRSETVHPVDALSMIGLTPTQRLEWLLGRGNLDADAHRYIEDLMVQYEKFLETTNCSEKELIERFLNRDTARDYMNSANKFGDRMFDAMAAVGKGNKFHRLLVV